MRFLNLILFSALLAADASTIAGTRLETIAFHSSALDRQTTYIALLPDPLAPGRKYPVLYLLHGAWGNYRDWSQNTSLTQLLNDKPMIVVTPDGGQFGWYADSPIEPKSRYESFITRDLIGEVDQRFPTSATRTARAIAGLSMGGHGALSLAAKHPELFSSASSLSGILRLQNHPAKWEIEKRLGKYPEARAEWSRHSVYDLVDEFTSAGIALLLDCGTSDSAGAIPDNRQVHERLSNRGIQHVYHEFPGTHDWKYWGANLPEHLDFHLKNFDQPLSTTAPQKRDHYRERTLLFEQENAQRWSNETTTRPIVLLGSSSMEIIKPDLLFPGIAMANRGIGGDRIGLGGYRGLLHRLYSGVFDCHPRAIFILNGTNDLAQTAKEGKPTVEEVAQCFAEVVRRIREGVPDAHLFIVSCTPTRDSHAASSPYIKQYNVQLQQLAETLADPLVHFVDTFHHVVGDDGLLKPEYTRDGLHLNPAGYHFLKAEFARACVTHRI
ncbi:MAG: alpha/beta fold hydrolase [Candidatus Sumerlaeaceae bacterium]